MDDRVPLSALQRVEARHWLRGLDHHVLSFTEALSPQTGMTVVTAGQFRAQVDELTRILAKIRNQFAPED